MSGIDTRLAVYGTLAPGKPNHHQLDGLDGVWAAGVVRGRLINMGWAAADGYPALVLDPHGGTIDVQVFSSKDLPADWSRLDAFEGDDYRRVAVDVAIGAASVEAWIYVAAA
jgi:gamma-glutamylcyclotransferase (GGCT)/AIG2-like uncharacterized protein YtfP